MMGKAKKGVYAAAITPIGADGEPDLARLVAYCRYLIDSGCDGVAPLGTTGEATSLPFGFRVSVPRALAAAGFASDEVILGAGSSAVGDAIAVGRAALDAGFPNLLVLPPYYIKEPPEEGLYAYYARIIDTLRDDRLRLYLYHIPQVTMVPISIGLVHRLKKRYGPQIAGLKDSSGSFASAKSFIGPDDFNVYPSSEAVLVDALAAGAAGVISASTNISAGLARRTLQASGAARDDLQQSLAAVRASIQKFPLVAAVKQIHAWRSGDDSWLRLLPPLVNLSPAEAAALRADMERLDAVAFARKVA